MHLLGPQAWQLSRLKGSPALVFNDPLVNLPVPSAFRVVWDGITLKNGATVIPIIVVVTDYVGRIVSELVDAPISQG